MGRHDRAGPADGPRRPSAGDPSLTSACAPASPSAAARALAVGALVVPQVLVLLVQGAAPVLLRKAPLLLLAMHPYEPWSVLVAARTAVVPFTAVVVGVRTVPACGGYLLGRWYGTKALDRLSRRRSHRWGRVPQQLLTGRTSAVLLVLYPGATASLFAGAGRLRTRTFLPLMLTGLMLGAAVSQVLARVAARPVNTLAGYVDRHGLVLSVVLVAVALAVGVRQRRASARE